jgi:hypothetical protein
MPFPHPRHGKPVVPELVRLNHLRNCALCHLPSADRDDPARGFMPVAGEPFPRHYYGGTDTQALERTGDFVRADVTLLHQHFSVNLPVAADGQTPSAARPGTHAHRKGGPRCLHPSWCNRTSMLTSELVQPHHLCRQLPGGSCTH